MIYAFKGFVKDGNKNRLREQDIRKIVDVWKSQAKIEKYSHFAGNKEIEKNEFNLNLPRYIDTSAPEDMQDIEAHLKGGIPQHDVESLDDFWTVYPSLKHDLFKNSSKDGYYELSVKDDDIYGTISNHGEYVDFKKSIKRIFDKWKKTTITDLRYLGKDTHPKAIIAELSVSLLEAFKGIKLIDKYDIYQHLMSYWEEIMQDDAHIITADEWWAGKQVIRLQAESKSGKNKGKKKDIAGLTGLEGRLIPVSLLIETYLNKEQEELDNLQNELEQAKAEMEEMQEEHGGDEELLESVMNEKGNITKKDLKARMKEIKDEVEFADELTMLEKYAGLLEKETDYKKKIKEAEKELEKKVIAKYPTLTIEEIKTLVVERKWMTKLEGRIMSEVDSMSQNLAGRVKELGERYDQTLPELEKETEALTRKVEIYLEKMGFKV